jgi:hypothetical protein
MIYEGRQDLHFMEGGAAFWKTIALPLRLLPSVATSVGDSHAHNSHARNRGREDF